MKSASLGFSLLELLVVVVIIGLLASYVGPRLFGQISKSERQVAKAQIDAFIKALDTYRLDIGGYPEAGTGLRALVDRPLGESRWNGPYLQKAPPADPWGRPYHYEVANGQALVRSFGKDGSAGGSGDDADVSSAD